MNCTKCKCFRGLEADSKFFYIKYNLEGDDSITLRPFIGDADGKKVVVCPKRDDVLLNWFINEETYIIYSCI